MFYIYKRGTNSVGKWRDHYKIICYCFIYFYILHILVNGNYTAWSAWEECSATCGGGIQQRVRTCTYPSPANGGKDCTALGPAVETKDCNSQPCPSEYSGLDMCSETNYMYMEPNALNLEIQGTQNMIIIYLVKKQRFPSRPRSKV